MRPITLFLIMILAASAHAQSQVQVTGVQYSAYLLDGPAYEANIVGQIPRDAVATVVDGVSSDRYVRVQYNGGAWWVGRKYLTFLGDTSVPGPYSPGTGSPAGSGPGTGGVSILGVDSGGTPTGPAQPGPAQPGPGSPGAGGGRPVAGDANGNGRTDFFDMWDRARQMYEAGIRFDDFDDDGIDNDGDWQPTDQLAQRDRTDHDRRMDDTGGDGVVGSGDTQPITPQIMVGWRYEARQFSGGEGDGRPTPGEPDFDFKDPQEALPDGMHRGWAHDGKDNDGDGQVDEPDELTLVCIDFVHECYKNAGLDLERLMREDARRNPRRYAALGPNNTADSPFLTRRIQNVKAFLMSSPDFRYSNEPTVMDVTSWNPQPAYVPGEIIFFRNPATGGGHSAIVGDVDPYTGRPVSVLNLTTMNGVQYQALDNNYLWGHAVVGRARPKAWERR